MAEASATPKKGSMLKKVLIGIVVVIGGFLGVVAVQPAEFRIVRPTTARLRGPARSTPGSATRTSAKDA